MSKVKHVILALALLAGETSMAQMLFNLQPVQAIVDEDLASNFAQLNTGMSAIEVTATMKREPQRKEISNHLGLEIQRLIWTQWTTGNTFQAVLVAGRLVSKSAEKKTMFG